MKVREIMTSQVMTVGPDTPVPALASLFASRGISGVPVVDGVAAAVTIAEALVRLGLRTSKVRTYAPPRPKRITGFPLTGLSQDG